MFCEVNIDQGPIRGKVLTAFNGLKYNSFEGIPYAKPPVGQLRFRNPQPPDTWYTIRDCTKPGNKCAQLNPLSTKGFEGSEDCLYLNIYTPSLPYEKLEKLPVLFFIHGGRLLIGYADYYKPDYFLQHNVILVTINYRLNVLGFLSLDIPEAPGNAGMKDCAMALKWVKKNISTFNGDANNITVFGESAGAAIATSFMTSEMTMGLFDKLIAQSGNHIADVFFVIQDHVSVASHVASLLGKETKDKRSLYDFFISVPVEDLVTASISAEMAKHPFVLNPVFMPVIEKEFEGVERYTSEHPKEKMRRNIFAKVPTITGSNMLEGAVFAIKNENGEIVYDLDNFKYFVPRSLYLEESNPKVGKIAKAIQHYYFKDKEVGDSTKYEYVRLISDAFFHRDIVAIAELIAKNNYQSYFYNFHFVGNMNINVMKSLNLEGTTHGDSIQYQFYKESKAKKCTERDMKIVDFFSEAWCNFAKYGKPTWNKQNLEWKPYTQKDRLTLIIDDEIRLVQNEDFANFRFFEDICEVEAKL